MAVVALVERGGRVRAMPMPRVTSETIGAAMRAHVDASSLMTAESPLYLSVGKKCQTHESVKHSCFECVPLPLLSAPCGCLVCERDTLELIRP